VKRWSASDLRPRIWPQVLRLVTNGDVGQAPSPADALVQGLSPSQLCWNYADPSSTRRYATEVVDK